LFSYCTRSNSTSNCTYPWGNPPFSHDQTFRWSSSHCNKGNNILIHKAHFMLSISWCFCNTFLPTPIQNNDWRVQVKQ
jgi:hypothetical protein